MSADELRARFSELAEPVVPMEDPHGRLMARRRKRFRVRFASVATATAAVVVGGIAAPSTMLAFGTRPELPPPEVVVQPSKLLTSQDYLDRLVKGPVRGNLSGNKEMVAEVQKGFSTDRPEVEGATDPRLVFLNQTQSMLQAVIVYAGGERPIAIARGTALNSTAKELLVDKMSYSAPLSPFLVIPVSDAYGKTRGVIGLAPPGCSVEYSAKAGFAPDGSWVRSYISERTGDYIMREASAVNELWRVSCDGKVREVRPADSFLDSVGLEENAEAMFERVVRYSGFSPNKTGIVKWRGRIDGHKSEMTLVASRPVPGPAMLAIGPFAKAQLATELAAHAAAGAPVPTATEEYPGWSMVALGVAGEGVSAVRIPELLSGQTVLGDRVFVFTDTDTDTDTDAVKVEALDSKLRVIATASTSQGVAILSFTPGSADTIRTISARGAQTSTVPFVEPATGSRVLGDQLFKAW